MQWEDLGRPLADLWKMANETRAYRGIAAELPSGLPERPSYPFPLRFDVVPGCPAGLPEKPSQVFPQRFLADPPEGTFRWQTDFINPTILLIPFNG